MTKRDPETYRVEHRPPWGGWVLVNAKGNAIGGPYASEEGAKLAREAAIARAKPHETKKPT